MIVKYYWTNMEGLNNVKILFRLTLLASTIESITGL